MLHSKDTDKYICSCSIIVALITLSTSLNLFSRVQLLSHVPLKFYHTNVIYVDFCCDRMESFKGKKK